MSIYIVDSNFFIQSNQMNYPLDVAIGFWKKVKEFSDNSIIISVDKVKKEIYNVKDDLQSWCENNLTDDFFIDTTIVLNEYTDICNWAVSRNDHYKPEAINEFLHADQADAWLVAYCAADKENRKLVTYEKSEPARRGKIKIPEACNVVGVEYFNIIDLFRKLGETF